MLSLLSLPSVVGWVGGLNTDQGLGDQHAGGLTRG
jgi:hypothetical protein